MKKITLSLCLQCIALLGYCQWYPQESNTVAHLYDVHFIDSNEGWIVGDSGVILHTDDGGETWNQQNSGTDIGLKSVYFLNSCKGWATGDTIIFHTSNGGNNWEHVFSSDSILQTLNSVFFLDSLHGWAVGHGPTFWGVPWPICLKSLDGGLTWDYSTHAGTNDIFFTDSLHGWSVSGVVGASTGYTTGYIWNTNDGGNSWEKQYTTPSAPPSSYGAILQSIHFFDLNNGWAVGYASNILHTNDGGNNWEIQENPTEGKLYGLSFTDSLCGWAVGQGPLWGDELILKTADGGEIWEEQFSGSDNRLHSVICVDQVNAWAVGRNGTILRTENGGVGLNNISKNRQEIIIFPNPASQTASIIFKLEKESNIIITVININGQEIKKFPIGFRKSGNYSLNCTDLSTGIYFVTLETESEILTRTLIIE
jgi:photosystem II stability/assembly factor-like uncharacterized protein